MTQVIPSIFGSTPEVMFGRSLARHFCTNPFAPTSVSPLAPGTYLGQRVLITGGGTGLGRGMAKLYAKLGADVLIVGRTRTTLEQTASDINALLHAPHRYANALAGHVGVEALDVRDCHAVSMLSQRLFQSDRLPTIIVNNAAANFACAVENLSENAWRSILETVLNGTIHMTTEFGKRIIARDAATNHQRGAVFLNISATYAATGTAFTVPSAVAKAGCDNLLRSLTAEWASHRMRFVGIAPGPVMTDGAFSRLDPDGKHRQTLAEINPSQRLGTVEEVANVASFLTSPYASWINGEIVRMDGGELCANSGEFNWLLQNNTKKTSGAHKDTEHESDFR